MPEYIDNLNEKQREAVFETEGYVRVIAGAGSGKTKLLVSRYAYLVKDYGIDSANILCVTFTNKAAGEMRRRIRGLIGDGYDTNLICTYHGFCNRLLRENPEKLFLNKGFQIIDSYQQKSILAEIYQKYELKLDYASFEHILRKIGKIKSKLDYVARMCDPEPCQIMTDIEDRTDQIIEDFLQRQKATYALDFHDLIAFAIFVLLRDEDVRDKWQKRLNYIMVDEFQDSSKIEMQLIEILSDNYRNLMIVGDPDQNIYEWRGSDVRLLVDFDKNHEKTNTVILSQNYRSTPQILKCANTLIEKNELRLKKDLFTNNPPGAEVVHYHSKNDFEEMDQVVASIKSLKRTDGYKFSDFAILYRSGFLSRIAEKKLVENNIPYEIFGGVKFYQRMEILDILAYLKLLAYDDDTSFRRIVNTPRRRFGRAKMNHLEQLKESSGKSMFRTLADNVDYENDFKASDAAKLVHLINDMNQRRRKMRISEIVNEITVRSGYEAYIRELGDEERLDNLAEFKRIANEFEKEFGEELSLEDFLQQIALQSGEDAEGDRETVKLMTIHASKGLEFPVVYILGFSEGIFPSAKTIEERKKEGLEEERRLCYVAITRAEKCLFLMDSEGPSQNGMKKLYSRFLDEIDESNYKRIGIISEDVKRESNAYRKKLNGEMGLGTQPVSLKKVGEQVEHHIFGQGTIEGIDPARGSYIVKFEKFDQPRNISKSYFETEHEDAREKDYPALPQPVPEQAAAATPENELAVQSVEELDITPDNDSTIIDTEIPEIELDEEAFDDDEDILEPEIIDTSVEVMPEEAKPMPVMPMQAIPEPASDFFANNLDIEAIDDNSEEYEITEAGAQIDEQTLSKLKDEMSNSPNLWKHPEVPKSGWSCSGVTDLGAPVGICRMCGHQIIRYAHHMEHPHYRSIVAGCICAGKMEGNIDEARRREAEFKNRQSRRITFFQRKWKRSHKGNEYLKLYGHVVVIYKIKNQEIWKYSIDNEFCRESFTTREMTLVAIFDRIDDMRK